jgi:hypothetical protein
MSYPPPTASYKRVTNPLFPHPTVCANFVQVNAVASVLNASAIILQQRQPNVSVNSSNSIERSGIRV